MIAELAAEYAARDQKTVIYTNKKLLTAQFGQVLGKQGIEHGYMAAGFPEPFFEKIQVASIQTIASRVFRRETWNLHEAHLVIIDEAHGNKAEQAQEILKAHAKMDVPRIGFTATPVGIGGLYNRLIVAGTNAELRQCGALVPCQTFAPDEPDLKEIKRNPDTGEFVEEDVVKRIMVAGSRERVPRIFGRVLEHWRLLNPAGGPTLLHAPSVKSSRWFAEWLTKQGVPAAHIDGDTPADERANILAASEDGTIQIVCNRFVLREGIDMPWLTHGILATAFGALGNYIQAGGRLLRAYPGKERVIIQDHGGNWWRPGFDSLNDDRAWALGDTNLSIARKSQKLREAGSEEDKEGLRCSRCGAINRESHRFWERGCWKCGHKFKRSVRVVVQTDGELKHQVGRATKRKQQRSEEEKIASSSFWRAVKSGMTCAQLSGWHRRTTGESFPSDVVRIRGRPISLPGPASEDWDRRVAKVFGIHEGGKVK